MLAQPRPGLGDVGSGHIDDVDQVRRVADAESDATAFPTIPPFCCSTAPDYIALLAPCSYQLGKNLINLSFTTGIQHSVLTG